ncbi:MAG TPA: hypothetical protein VFN61_06075 [Acidimicrobiales bacterium]|nr:hypothetical protein [Acidimicrobiales bacterium]
MPEPGDGAGAAGAAEHLALLERQISASETALARLPAWQPLPADLIALLATAIPVHAEQLPRGLEPRVARLMDRIDALTAELGKRERLLAGRLAAVRATRRSGRAPSLVDYKS